MNVHVVIDKHTGTYTVSAPAGVIVSVTYTEEVSAEPDVPPVPPKVSPPAPPTSPVALPTESAAPIKAETRCRNTIYAYMPRNAELQEESVPPSHEKTVTPHVESIPCTAPSFNAEVNNQSETTVQDIQAYTVEQCLHNTILSVKTVDMLNALMQTASTSGVTREYIATQYKCTITKYDYLVMVRALCRMDLLPPFRITGSHYLLSKADIVLDAVMYQRQSTMHDILQDCGVKIADGNLSHLLSVAERIRWYTEIEAPDAKLRHPYHCLRKMIAVILNTVVSYKKKMYSVILAKMLPGSGIYAEVALYTYLTLLNRQKYNSRHSRIVNYFQEHGDILPLSELIQQFSRTERCIAIGVRETMIQLQALEEKQDSFERMYIS